MPGARLCRVVGLQLGLQISSIRVARGSAANTAEMLERAGVVFIAADERGGRECGYVSHDEAWCEPNRRTNQPNSLPGWFTSFKRRRSARSVRIFCKPISMLNVRLMEFIRAVSYREILASVSWVSLGLGRG